MEKAWVQQGPKNGAWWLRGSTFTVFEKDKMTESNRLKFPPGCSALLCNTGRFPNVDRYFATVAEAMAAAEQTK
jgi:hypothetical protein